MTIRDQYVMHCSIATFTLQAFGPPATSTADFQASQASQSILSCPAKFRKHNKKNSLIQRDKTKFVNVTKLPPKEGGPRPPSLGRTRTSTGTPKRPPPRGSGLGEMVGDYQLQTPAGASLRGPALVQVPP